MYLAMTPAPPNSSQAATVEHHLAAGVVVSMQHFGQRAVSRCCLSLPADILDGRAVAYTLLARRLARDRASTQPSCARANSTAGLP